MNGHRFVLPLLPLSLEFRPEVVERAKREESFLERSAYPRELATSMPCQAAELSAAADSAILRALSERTSALPDGRHCRIRFSPAVVAPLAQQKKSKAMAVAAAEAAARPRRQRPGHTYLSGLVLAILCRRQSPRPASSSSVQSWGLIDSFRRCFKIRFPLSSLLTLLAPLHLLH